jgi:uncharacterized membrane protein (DUF373 family)
MEMTGIPLEGGADGRPAGPEPSAVSPADSSPPRSRWRAAPAVRRWIWVLEHAQDVVAITVGVVLIVLAAVVLVAAIADFIESAYRSITSGRNAGAVFTAFLAAAPELLDRVLLVLILVEIVYTVVLSLRAHRLVAQPFIVVGLIAVIREILVVLTPGSTTKVSASELALLIGMVAVFVASLIAVSFFEKGSDGAVLGASEADDRD